MIKISIILGEELPPSTLQLVEIYFDTATFDDIERDKKIKTEAQLSLIGGTMGLLTGFSIISGVEVIFFLFRFVLLNIESFQLIQTLNDHFPGYSVPSESRELMMRFPKNKSKGRQPSLKSLCQLNVNTY